MNKLTIELNNVGHIDINVQREMGDAVNSTEKLIMLEIQRCTDTLTAQKKKLFPDADTIEYCINRRNEMQELLDSMRKVSYLVTDVYNSLI